jgi:DDE superfamily endonuclease
MLTVPPLCSVLTPFTPLFSRRVWAHVQVLLIGAILAPGIRTVASALRIMGLAHTRRFQRYHRVLNRDRWSSRAASRALLRLLVDAFAPDGPLGVGLDETLERRKGKKIAAKGVYRDAVHSSHEFFVKAMGLRWVCLMLLAPIPWAGRTWALPFLTALAPSERYDEAHRRRHKKLTDWGRQLLLQVRRWAPERAIVVVADSGDAALARLDRCRRLRRPITVVTRRRLDAALDGPAPPRQAGARGRPRLKGKRLPTLAQRLRDAGTVWETVIVPRWDGAGPRAVEVASETAVWYHGGLPPVPLRWVLIRDPEGKFDSQALLCTDLDTAPAQALAWFVLRWQLEVTLEEARRHLGVETQRQWSEPAILRTTPALLGLFSVVTLLAHPRMRADPPVRQAAWYRTATPTFSDALALVRRERWCDHVHFSMSQCDTEMVKVPRALVERLTEAVCYAA